MTGPTAIRPWSDLAAGDGLCFWGADARAVIERGCGGLVYVATPYTRLARVPGTDTWSYQMSAMAQERAIFKAVPLVAAGLSAVAPVILASQMCHRSMNLDPLDERFWARWCRPILSSAALVWVPEIRGWAESRGVRFEVATALSRNVPVLIEAARPPQEEP